ncbi:hypothetical protein HN371_28810 [Candidatus Poribacteria bacterium]|jgi:hypothetical protein|nr:hypothetical protein [Candidatus Poribacteria bacterium]MBT5536491.1 hypothetical protein [Candidatus Poribacteria bacterium]MBT5714745.1 hypothetical protein [Candidatus Poribacteria bacterium]MBT7099208.1 hypothetical protein [Candidatus Poribacteria bacterium]MBT7805514.1 hypothetical protein [Candidatus Poribacteria bacterium]
MIWIAVWSVLLTVIFVGAAHHMRACADCGKRAAYPTGQTRQWAGANGSDGVAVDVAVADQRESSCNACGHTFWGAT